MSSRVQFILIGMLGGFAFWGLFDRFEVLETWRLAVPALVGAGAFFFATLAMAADLGLRRAALAGGAIAAVAGGLVALKGLGFESGAQMLATGHLGGAMVALAVMPVPFALGWGLGGRAGLTDYRVLFTESWNIVVRYVSAGLFVATALLVLWLLGALLQLVGVTVLHDVLRDDLGLWLISGAVLGLAFSVVTELSDTVSPYLLLRLLRLLTPLVLGVVVVFVAALPLRGLGALFGEISAASALLATAIAAIGLISIVADEDDVEAAQGLILTLSARGLMALVPVLAGLAIWALALRIGQYGWTPERVAASALAFVVAGYGLGYLLALGLGGRWRAALRRVNVAMALAILALAVLWLSPGLSPEAIAVRSQLARFEAGRATVAQLPLWEMKHDWGLAGQRGLERLGARDEAALAERLQQLATAEGRWQFEHAAETGAPALDRLRAAVTLWPAGAAWPEGLAETLAGDLRAPDLGGCAAAAGGGSGRCALVLADLLPQVPGPEAVFLNAAGYFSADGVQVLRRQESGDWVRGGQIVLGDRDTVSVAEMIAALRAGAPETASVTVQVLRLGRWQVGITP
ncbi:DUF4153 domain-containing protein [Rhodobacter capsulatus]|uniref:Membrane protein, putative n=1 Tax=Rhodobacter capsulatus (strain ATCC BAA-309 / NBRC 16581 / SB1003) TaxID=272942 RepID=D5AN71_RHOCB|nr:DUF4153 domain-containing protein [Rhodobacter capsulatus]ADE86361.1 membrane protein, putative [Rhodobacter capsulatus SB 1003]ETD00852.1 hypothetical protein U714_14540 [Rhodobacter capsulatus DE442]ETD75470.1 hypothetical protein U717_14695 [Rhodobacter capsulatus R121]ETE52868.1 hypothetical protein U715_14690 [Rhodobacter capsulatus Y262]MDS0928170.1 DUF4153 domain-containing protein [Rhodobacter capsulatus]